MENIRSPWVAELSSPVSITAVRTAVQLKRVAEVEAILSDVDASISQCSHTATLCNGTHGRCDYTDLYRAMILTISPPVLSLLVVFANSNIPTPAPLLPARHLLCHFRSPQQPSILLYTLPCVHHTLPCINCGQQSLIPFVAPLPCFPRRAFTAPLYALCTPRASPHAHPRLLPIPIPAHRMHACTAPVCAHCGPNVFRQQTAAIIVVDVHAPPPFLSIAHQPLVSPNHTLYAPTRPPSWMHHPILHLPHPPPRACHGPSCTVWTYAVRRLANTPRCAY